MRGSVVDALRCRDDDNGQVGELVPRRFCLFPVDSCEHDGYYEGNDAEKLQSLLRLSNGFIRPLLQMNRLSPDLIPELVVSMEFLKHEDMREMD